MASNKRTWFHCSASYLGDSFAVLRRTPRHMATGEPPTPRLCVAPSIACCFASVLFRTGSPVYSYRTRKPSRGIAPRGVWDAVITGERWLIPPTTLVLHRVIPIEDVEKAQFAVRWYHSSGRSSSLRVRVAQLAIAATVLGSTSDRRRSQRFCDIVGIKGDPESYLLSLLSSVGSNDDENPGGVAQ